MRACAGAAVLILTSLLSAPGFGQDYPTRPVRFVVGFGPGGIADIMARLLGQKLTEFWGQNVIVDNRPGASGTIALQIAAQANPDGYTLLLGSSTQFSIMPAMRSKLPFDPVGDYTPISLVALTPGMLTVRPSHPARSVQDLIKLAIAGSPPAESYSSAGVGVAPQIAAELLNHVAGIKIRHIPYKGGAAAVVAVIAGEVPMSFGAVATSLPHLKAGRLRALGVTSAKRLSAAPDVPTFIESGLPGFEVVQWFGLFGPARLDRRLVQRIDAAVARALASPDFKSHFAAQGVEPTHMSPEQFDRYVGSELVRWKQTIRNIGLAEKP